MKMIQWYLSKIDVYSFQSDANPNQKEEKKEKVVNKKEEKKSKKARVEEEEEDSEVRDIIRQTKLLSVASEKNWSETN